MEKARLQEASERAAHEALVPQKSSSSMGSLSYIKKLFSYNHPCFLIATKALSCFGTHCAGSSADQQETLPMVDNEVEIPLSQLALEDPMAVEVSEPPEIPPSQLAVVEVSEPPEIPPSQLAVEETMAVEVSEPPEIPPSQLAVEETMAVEVSEPPEISPSQPALEDTKAVEVAAPPEIPAVEEVPSPDLPSAPQELQCEDKEPEGPEAKKPEEFVEPPLRRVEVMLPDAMAKAIQELATETEAKDSEEFRRQQLQMRATEKEQADAARNEKKEKKASEPKAAAKGKAKAKGRPRNKEGNEKADESAAPDAAPKTPEPKRRRTAAVAEDGKGKTKRTRDPAEKSEPAKPKAKAARKSKAGAEEVDETMVSEYVSFMHKYDGCVYDKAFDALFDKQLSLP